MSLDISPKKSLKGVVKQRKTKVYPDKNSPLPFLGMEHIEPHKLKPNGFGRFSEMRSSANIFDIGDVLYGRMRPYLNKVYKAELAGACSGEFIVLQPVDVDADYLKFLLHSRDFVKYASALSSGDRPRVAFKKLEAYELFTPSPTLQRAIVARIDQLFSQLDEGEKSLQHAETLLAQYKQAVLKAAVSGELTRDWREKKPKLATQWEETTLGKFGKWTSGGTPSKTHPEYYGGAIPWVKTGDLTDGDIDEAPDKITQLGLDNSSAKIFPIGTLLMAMYGATIGKLGILKIPAATNQACAALLNDTNLKVNIYFAFYYLLAMRDSFKEMGQGGAQPNISQTIIKAFPVSLPSPDEQKEIVSRVEQALSVFSYLEQSLKKSKATSENLRQSILHAAFSGQLVKEPIT